MAHALVTTGASILWIGLALTWFMAWDNDRQRRADLEIQHGGGIKHKSGCRECARPRIEIKKRLVYEPKHSRHLAEQSNKGGSVEGELPLPHRGD